MVDSCPPEFDYNAWSSLIDFFSPCFFDIIMYGAFTAVFWAGGFLYLLRFMWEDFSQSGALKITLLPRKTCVERCLIIDRGGQL